MAPVGSTLAARLHVVLGVTAAAIAAALAIVIAAQEARAATVAADCTVGQYFDGDACVAIPLGSGGTGGEPDGTGSTGIELCAAGKFRSDAATTSCVAIPLGSGGTGGESDGTGSTGIELCAAGKFRSDAATTSCVAIPLGSGGTGGSEDGRGSTGTAACEAGAFRGDASTTRCVRASVGFFVEGTSAQAEVAIPLGSRGTGGGSDGRGSKAVEPCPAGTFRGDAATTSCTDAPAGSFVAATGATAATVCPLGQFQPDTGKSSCIPAPAGSHVPVTGSPAAALCPPGSYSASTGASACTPAAVGHYVPRPGSTAQLRCLSATEAGLAVCPAPAATPTPTPERDAPETGDEPLSPQGDECPPGTWSTTGTSRAGSTCTPASPGTFVASPGATAEELCPAGTFSDGFGATECTPAPVGTFVAEVGAMDPVPCPGAMETGMTDCPEPEVTALPTEQLTDPTDRTSVWWWFGGLALVLAAGGAGFVLVQRRTGALDAAVSMAGAGASTLTDLPGIDATSSDLRAADPGPVTGPAASSSVPDVLEWDEALDGVLDDEQDPPPNPA